MRKELVELGNEELGLGFRSSIRVLNVLDGLHLAVREVEELSGRRPNAHGWGVSGRGAAALANYSARTDDIRLSR